MNSYLLLLVVAPHLPPGPLVGALGVVLLALAAVAWRRSKGGRR